MRGVKYIPAKVQLEDLDPRVNLASSFTDRAWAEPGVRDAGVGRRLTLGQLFLFTRYLWKARPAFRIGLSILPPPPMQPTMALLAEGITFLEPLGSFTLVLLVSGLWAMTVA